MVYAVVLSVVVQILGSRSSLARVWLMEGRLRPVDGSAVDFLLGSTVPPDALSLLLLEEKSFAWPLLLERAAPASLDLGEGSAALLYLYPKLVVLGRKRSVYSVAFVPPFPSSFFQPL